MPWDLKSLKLPLQETNIPHLGKWKIIFKTVLGKGYVSSLEGTNMNHNQTLTISVWSGVSNILCINICVYRICYLLICEIKSVIKIDDGYDMSNISTTDMNYKHRRDK